MSNLFLHFFDYKISLIKNKKYFLFILRTLISHNTQFYIKIYKFLEYLSIYKNFKIAIYLNNLFKYNSIFKFSSYSFNSNFFKKFKQKNNIILFNDFVIRVKPIFAISLGKYIDSFRIFKY